MVLSNLLCRGVILISIVTGKGYTLFLHLVRRLGWGDGVVDIFLSIIILSFLPLLLKYCLKEPDKNIAMAVVIVEPL